MGLHLLSTVPPHLVSEAAMAIDDAFFHTALVLLGRTKTPMPPAALLAYARIRDTILSPIRPGGMGLPCHTTTADAAYVASWMRVAARVVDIVPGAHDEVLTLAVTRLKLCPRRARRPPSAPRRASPRRPRGEALKATSHCLAPITRRTGRQRHAASAASASRASARTGTTCCATLSLAGWARMATSASWSSRSPTCSSAACTWHLG